MKIKNLLPEDVQEILTEDSINAIQTAINDKVSTENEKVLKEQDEDYAKRLKFLIQTIDRDHTAKMKRILESNNKDKTAKLVQVIKKYEREQNGDISKFKKSIVESVGLFIDEFINETLPKEDLRQAVDNKMAYNVLENIRGVLAVDSVMMKESISSAIIEGKEKQDKLEAENEKLKKQAKILQEQAETAKRELFLESKTSKFSDQKRKFVNQALEGKSLKFIQENFDYTLRLFEKGEKKQQHIIKENAIRDREHKPDFVPKQKVVEEKVNKNNTMEDEYLSVMNSQRF